MFDWSNVVYDSITEIRITGFQRHNTVIEAKTILETSLSR